MINEKANTSRIPTCKETERIGKVTIRCKEDPTDEKEKSRKGLDLSLSIYSWTGYIKEL